MNCKERRVCKYYGMCVVMGCDYVGQALWGRELVNQNMAMLAVDIQGNITRDTMGAMSKVKDTPCEAKGRFITKSEKRVKDWMNSQTSTPMGAPTGPPPMPIGLGKLKCRVAE